MYFNDRPVLLLAFLVLRMFVLVGSEMPFIALASYYSGARFSKVTNALHTAYAMRRNAIRSHWLRMANAVRSAHGSSGNGPGWLANGVIVAS